VLSRNKVAVGEPVAEESLSKTYDMIGGKRIGGGESEGGIIFLL
jgi:hypothetical protein